MKKSNLPELILAVQEKNLNRREEILAVENKFHFWRIFSETAKSAKISPVGKIAKKQSEGVLKIQCILSKV